MKSKGYVPALTFNFLTPWYDFLSNIRYSESYFRRVAGYIRPKNGDSILDVGVGTANLAIALKKIYPNVTIVGVDPDEHILKIAKNKIYRKRLDIKLIKAFAQKLPFEDNSFDFVVSRLTIHHIPKQFRKQAFLEMKRVLKKNGVILIIDIGVPKNLLARMITYVLSLIEEVGPNRKGLIPQLLKELQFKQIEEVESRFGILSHYRGRKPS